MTKKHLKIGQIGERVAAAFLIKKGHQIIDKNYKKKFGEIDLIAKAPDETLIFCEVKTSINKKGIQISFAPEDHADKHKLNKMKRMAQFFSAKHPMFITEEKGWRIDLIAITLEEAGDKKFLIKQIHHYENVA
ncbi:MAG TPA: YraN family protein [Candidatus Paceibacterota bacterium]|nr:YraN family protein [Candidatus Paceibacterota bacterium]